jgi:hypothetical protein
MVLDAYSRATDSLMDVIGGSQARSLAYLSLKECTFLTDTGFRNIARFELLEFLDLSHCRITDKTLAFTLSTFVYTYLKPMLAIWTMLILSASQYYVNDRPAILVDAQLVGN